MATIRFCRGFRNGRLCRNLTVAGSGLCKVCLGISPKPLRRWSGAEHHEREERAGPKTPKVYRVAEFSER